MDSNFAIIFSAGFYFQYRFITIPGHLFLSGCFQKPA